MGHYNLAQVSGISLVHSFQQGTKLSPLAKKLVSNIFVSNLFFCVLADFSMYEGCSKRIAYFYLETSNFK